MIEHFGVSVLPFTFNYILFCQLSLIYAGFSFFPFALDAFFFYSILFLLCPMHTDNYLSATHFIPSIYSILSLSAFINFVFRRQFSIALNLFGASSFYTFCQVVEVILLMLSLSLGHPSYAL